MLKYGVSNLRRLKDVPPLTLGPITVLVGRNSSGKSTYLRSLPLLRQSIFTRTSSPILWYGDLVDFGAYDTSVTDNDKNNLIEFTFGTDVLTPTYTERPWAMDIEEPSKFQGAIYKVTITPEGFMTRIKNINLAFADPKLEYNIELDPEGKISCLKVNGNTVQLNLEGITLALSPGTIFPEFRIVRKGPRIPTQYYLYMTRGVPKLKELVEDFLRPHLSSRLSPEKLEEIAYKALTLGPAPESDIEAKNFRTGNKSLNNFLSSLVSPDKSKVRREFVDVLGAAFLPELLNNATSVFKLMISETLYIGPARARSERYYRYQDLAVSEIDPDGKNFPMFLNSLSNTQMRQLSKWIESLFGYGLSVSRTEGPGHLSINITEGDMRSNLVDVGYGVSQILPVLAQIWWARERKDPRPNRNLVPALLAIEQPELHLHPAHQALLADAIVGEARSKPSDTNRKDVNFLVETHSETFINRLGELVAKNKISPEDINIVLFEPDPTGERITTTSIATFESDGSLCDWPYGFFQPSVR